MKGTTPDKTVDRAILVVDGTGKEIDERETVTNRSFKEYRFAALPPGTYFYTDGERPGVRRDLPRELDLDALTDADLQEVVLTHNLTPRKCLGFLTPLQALLGELGSDVRIRFA